MNHPLVLLTYITGLGEILLSAYFIKTNSGSEIRKVMALLCASTGLWVLLCAYEAYRPETVINHAINNLLFVAGLILLTTLLYLVIIFPYRMRYFDSLHVVMMYVPVILFTVILFGTKTIVVKTVADAQNVGITNPGPIYLIYNLYLIFLYLFSIGLLALRSTKLSGFQRRNVLIFLVSLLLGGLPAVAIDLFAPFIGLYQLNYLYGNLASVFWLGGVTYILTAKVRD